MDTFFDTQKIAMKSISTTRTPLTELEKRVRSYFVDYSKTKNRIRTISFR